MSVKDFRTEVDQKKRFEFGKNWVTFLSKLTDQRIRIAEDSLCEMLDIGELSGKRFLDIGCGSGLSSLAAKNKGAKVTSFDYDESSVWCTTELKRKYYPDSDAWDVCQGSALDRDFLSSLGKHDIVYSWGVLHHTGRMWVAIDNSLSLVDDDGIFFIAIYNDQGFKSHSWWVLKNVYNKLPRLLRKPFAFTLGFSIQFLALIKYIIKLKPMVIIKPLFNYKQSRGMSLLTDMIDWYGGFPYEFAKYEYLIDYIENKGFKLVKGKEALSLGCHELVFSKNIKK